MEVFKSNPWTTTVAWDASGAQIRSLADVFDSFVVALKDQGQTHVVFHPRESWDIGGLGIILLKNKEKLMESFSLYYFKSGRFFR